MLAPWIIGYIIGYIIIGVVWFSILLIRVRKTMDKSDEYAINMPAHIILFIAMVIFWPMVALFAHSLLQALRRREERNGNVK